MILHLYRGLQHDAYVAGHKAGRLDGEFGVQSSYAWNCLWDLNDYAAAYSQGYRDGWQDAKARLAAARIVAS